MHITLIGLLLTTKGDPDGSPSQNNYPKVGPPGNNYTVLGGVLKMSLYHSKPSLVLT